MHASRGWFQSGALCLGFGMEISDFHFSTLPLGLLRYVFLWSQLTKNSNRTTVFFSMCSIWGADFVTWIWLLKFCISVYIFKEYVHVSCLNVAASVSRAHIFGQEPEWKPGRGSSLCSFSFSYRAMERPLEWWEGGGPWWGQREEWQMHKGTWGFICTSDNRTVRLYFMCFCRSH